MPGKRNALLIATSSFDDSGLQRLRSPTRDIGDLARVLEDPQVGDFEVAKLLDFEHGKVMRMIEEFFANRSTNDLLLLHISTHGLKSDHGELHFAAKNTERAFLASTGVPASFLRAQMTQCRAKTIVLLLDCCYSGAFLPGTKGDSTVHIKDELSGFGRAILTATNRTEYAWEGETLSEEEPQSSNFTGAIIEGLRTGRADLDRDGKVSVQNLYDYICDSLYQQNKKQSPLMWTEIQYQVVVARSPFGQSSETKLTADSNSAITMDPEVKSDEDAEAPMYPVDETSRDFAISQLKRALPDPVRRIEVFDLIDQQVTAIVANSDLEKRPLSGPFFADNLTGFRADCDTILYLLVLGVFHDQGLHDKLWVRVVERLCRLRNQPVQSFREDVEILRLFPALLSVWAIGIAAVLADREEVISSILIEPKIMPPFGNQNKQEASTYLNPVRVIAGDEIHKICHAENGAKYFYPQSHYLRDQLRAPFQSIEPDDSAYLAACNRFEFLASMISLDDDESIYSAMWPGEFLLDSSWGYDGRGLASEILQELTPNWPLVAGGAFGRDVERAQKAYEKLVTARGKTHHW